MVILNAGGTPIITSDSQDGNIGFPQGQAGKAHFEHMIRSTAKNLSNEEIAEFSSGLETEEND